MPVISRQRNQTSYRSLGLAVQFRVHRVRGIAGEYPFEYKRVERKSLNDSDVISLGRIMNPILRTIIDIFEQRGNEAYGAEPVTQLQHALQCASLAQQEGGDDDLVAAALLHDIGHILEGTSLPEGMSGNFDDSHEEKAFVWLKSHFGDRVADPIRLHVAAKRYLCTVDPSYQQNLSPVSLKSFHDQGGVMNSAECSAFESEPFFEEALRLRRWDDAAKDPNCPTADLNSYLPLLTQIL